MKRGDRVVICRKRRVIARGEVQDYCPHDGYMGNPEKWVTVAIDKGPLLSFRAGTQGREWMGRSRTARRWGFVEIKIEEAAR